MYIVISIYSISVIVIFCIYFGITYTECYKVRLEYWVSFKIF